MNELLCKEEMEFSDFDDFISDLFQEGESLNYLENEINENQLSSPSVFPSFANQITDLAGKNEEDLPLTSRETTSSTNHKRIDKKSEPPELSLYWHYKSNSLNAPIHFPNVLTIAFNSHEPELVKECLHHICTPNVKIFRMEYNLKKFVQKREAAITHEYTAEQYVNFYHGMIANVPDSICQVHSHRICYEEETSIFICMGNYSGTIVNQFPTGSTIPFAANGSVVMFRNKMGKIFRIEFYIEYSKIVN